MWLSRAVPPCENSSVVEQKQARSTASELHGSTEGIWSGSIGSRGNGAADWCRRSTFTSQALTEKTHFFHKRPRLRNNKRKPYGSLYNAVAGQSPEAISSKPLFSPLKLLESKLLKPLLSTFYPSTSATGKESSDLPPVEEPATVSYRLFSRSRKFDLLQDLVGEEFGGKVIYATDQFYGAASNVLKSAKPQLTEEFSEMASTADGWLTSRRRVPTHDWIIVKLGVPGRIYGCFVSTRGMGKNVAPYISVEGACTPDLEKDIESCLAETSVQLDQVDFPTNRVSDKAAVAINNLMKLQTEENSSQWRDLVEMSSLYAFPDREKHYFVSLNALVERPVTHVRVNLFPDGGISRLKLYGVAKPLNPARSGLVNLTSHKSGSVVILSSNRNYKDCNHPRNLLLGPERIFLSGKEAVWLTPRKVGRHPCLEYQALQGDSIINLIGEDWIIIRLAERGSIVRLELDFMGITGNIPESIQIRGVDMEGYTDFNDIEHQQQMFESTGSVSDPSSYSSLPWKMLLKKIPLTHNTVLSFETEHEQTDQTWPGKENEALLIQQIGKITHICVVIYPDGAFRRIRAWGTVKP